MNNILYSRTEEKLMESRYNNFTESGDNIIHRALESKKTN